MRFPVLFATNHIVNFYRFSISNHYRLHGILYPREILTQHPETKLVTRYYDRPNSLCGQKFLVIKFNQFWKSEVECMRFTMPIAKQQWNLVFLSGSVQTDSKMCSQHWVTKFCTNLSFGKPVGWCVLVYFAHSYGPEEERFCYRLSNCFDKLNCLWLIEFGERLLQSMGGTIYGAVRITDQWHKS